MSDLEDEDVILDDIRALQAALTEQKPVRFKECVSSEDPVTPEPDEDSPSTSKTIQDLRNASDPSLAEENSETEDNDSSEENNLEDLSDPEAALNLNRKIITLLSTAQKRLQLLLKECKKRQALVDQKIQQKTLPCQNRTLLTIVGIPYFKDKQQFPAPMNRDAKVKARRAELQIIALPCPLRWTLKDRNALYEAIYFDAKVETSSDTEDPLRLDFRSRHRKLPEELVETIKQLVGPLGSREFDWLKIAATDFNGRHSASECRAMWQVFLHPDINKGKWKKDEDSRLKTFAEEYNYQNWDAIAQRLGTSRSGYQCFIRFNTNFKNNMLRRNSSWSKEEDQKLTDIINGLRTGNFIPWGEVAKLMGGRRKQQIYMRWNYSLAPNLKKGRFTEDEDKLLLEGVAKFGSNFTKISIALMPHRTTAQLNDHYRTLMNEKTNEWSCKDDVKLVKLFDKFGNDWATIAREFSNKSRVQVRHRHASVIRYLSRGLSIKTIPRWGAKIEDNNSPEELLARGRDRFHELSEALYNTRIQQEDRRKKKLPSIDLELRDYFKGIYPTSAKIGRNRKFYTDKELVENNQKLRVVLNMLNANLDLPDDLEEDLHLTEKEKQVLISLGECSEDESVKSEEQQKNLEQVRRKMFGSLTPVPDEEFYVPPLPFDGKPIKPRRKQLVGINYTHDGQKYLAELTREFETAGEVVSLIGGWNKEMEFQKMKDIIVNKRESSVVQTQLSYAKDLISPYTGVENSFNIVDPNVPSTSGTIAGEITSSGHQLAWTTTQRTGKKPFRCNPEMYMPPNYATLLGFRGILLSKHVLEADNSTDNEYEEENYTMSREGERALELFEERLVKLFKFPIELSEIAPPILHRVKNGVFDDLDSDNCMDKRKAVESNLGPAAKRKRKLVRGTIANN